MHDPVVLPATYARELIGLSERFGVPSECLLEEIGHSLQELTQPALRLSLRTVSRLARRAVELTGEPGLGFYMGLQMRISLHGFLGFASMTAPDLRAALSLSERFTKTRTAAISHPFVIEHERVSMLLEEHVDLGDAREFLVAALFSSVAQLSQALTGKQLSGVMDFSFPERPHHQHFARLLHAEFRFGRPFNRLTFPIAYLDYPIITADPVATQLAREQCERELAALGEANNLVEQVRGILQGAGKPVPRVEEVARRLGVSTRTLKRRLGDQHSSYSKIVDAYLYRQALLLLDDPNLSIDEVADRLGYSDAANFTRAFKRWTGSAPAGFRARRSG